MLREIDRRQRIIVGATVGWSALVIVELLVPAFYRSAWWPLGPVAFLALASAGAARLIRTGWDPPRPRKRRARWQRLWRRAWTTAPLFVVTVLFSYAAWVVGKELGTSDHLANFVSTLPLWSMRPKKLRRYARFVAAWQLRREARLRGSVRPAAG